MHLILYWNSSEEKSFDLKLVATWRSVKSHERSFELKIYDRITQAYWPMTVHNSPLEQFTLLAKSARGAAAVELIKQALEVIDMN